MSAASRCAAAIVIALAMTGCQPEDETPGLWLRGDAALEPVDDWRFTNDIEEIFVETRPWYGIPHSTTIWCVELDGALYVGSYGEEKKVWEKNLASDTTVKLAIAGKLYEATLVPVTDPNQVEVLDAAYAKKYDMAEVFGDAIPEWWYYQVAARS
jgi:hypothetical protein